MIERRQIDSSASSLTNRGELDEVWHDCPQSANTSRSHYSVHDRNTEADFTVFMDREKSKTFKKMWHACDFDPLSRARWSKMQELIKGRKEAVIRNAMAVTDGFHILMWLGMRPEEHRRVLQDMWDAKAAMAIFFKPFIGLARTLLLNQTGSTELEGPALSDNEGRAKALEPYARSPCSNMTRTKELFEGIDLARKTKKDGVVRDWDVHCRPQLAQMARAGVVGPGYYPDPCGFATATADPGKQPHITLDYRIMKEYWPTNLNNLRDPSKIHLLRLAQSFARKHDDARFALLRIWTHPVFYPLMLGADNRESTSFSDTIGRAWEFKFVPKDMPGSEFSIQKSVEDRLNGAALPQIVTGPQGTRMVQPRFSAPRFHNLFRGKTAVKRDMVLVMGQNEKDLERLTTAATFALQTNPWRLEIDFYKSFVNVDLQLLEGLDDKWLE